MRKAARATAALKVPINTYCCHELEGNRCLERDGAGLNGVIQHGYEILELTMVGSYLKRAQSFTPSHRSHLPIHSVELDTQKVPHEAEKIAVKALVSIIVEKPATLSRCLRDPDALYVSNPVLLCENGLDWYQSRSRQLFLLLRHPRTLRLNLWKGMLIPHLVPHSWGHVCLKSCI